MGIWEEKDYNALGDLLLYDRGAMMRITRKITRKLRVSGVLRAKSKITCTKLRENKNKPLPVF